MLIDVVILRSPELLLGRRGDQQGRWLTFSSVLDRRVAYLMHRVIASLFETYVPAHHTDLGVGGLAHYHVDVMSTHDDRCGCAMGGRRAGSAPAVSLHI